MKFRPSMQLRFRDEAQYERVKHIAKVAGLSANEYVVWVIEQEFKIYDGTDPILHSKRARIDLQGGGKSEEPDEAAVSHGGAVKTREGRRVDARPGKGRAGRVLAEAPVTTVGSSPTPATNSDDNRVDGLGNLLSSHPANCQCRFHKREAGVEK